ncbi:lysophospholipid acyltransferase family protein [Bythopirellula polymerisocia]|uniref:Lipid A biosynthesis lauroyl acyltransferase n=1 Tax=Bythopirellula polymerisocia TaxID=2528003 RepID=A0A5C6C9K1_9BACT|nr:lipid A biosynthesis acyltransferase [Bythopirellula polymerisocia]TWU20848.1 lipid A biosynthesis lauroyl acyltransferase [Bythopirellula polymerisocia]
MRKKQTIDFALYLLVRLLICGVQALPLSALKILSDHMGSFCWHVLKLRRSVVEENLRIAFPEVSQAERDRIALAMWKHLFLMICEIAHAPRKLHRTNWRQHSSISRMRDIVRHLVSDRPMVIISGHLGNFELGGYLLALHGFETHTIARPLDNRYLDDYVNRFRGAKGQYMLPKQGSGPQITELLQRGGTLVLLGDQFAGKGGCWVDFFGKPASTHKAVAVFSLGSAAPTAVSAALRGKNPLEFRMEIAAISDPAAADFQWTTVPLLTDWYTQNLESMVRRHPEQYWWVHRRWKGDPSDRRRIRKTHRQQKAA